MAILLPSTAFVRAFETSEVVQAGAITLQDDTDLAHIRMLIYKHGAIDALSQIRLKVYTDSGYANLLATSDWVTFSDVSSATYWWGWVRFDFSPSKPVDSATAFYVAVETANYSHSGSAFLSASLDWPVTQNTQASSPLYGFAMQIYGYRDV